MEPGELLALVLRRRRRRRLQKLDALRTRHQGLIAGQQEPLNPAAAQRSAADLVDVGSCPHVHERERSEHQAPGEVGSKSTEGLPPTASRRLPSEGWLLLAVLALLVLGLCTLTAIWVAYLRGFPSWESTVSR